jgi:hypothetical protein
VEKLAAQRIGNDVYLTFTIPTQNIDSSTPADVDHIDLFGATSLTSPPLTRVFEIATKVATVDVRPLPPPAEGDAAAPAPARPDLPAQGTIVTVRDRLTPEALAPKELPAPPARGNSGAASASPPVPAPVVTLPRRFYVAAALSERGRSGPPGMLVEVPLLPLPEPPAEPTISATPDNLVIAWEPSGGVVGFLLEKPVPLEPPPLDEPDLNEARPGVTAPVPAGPILYNVYREPPAAEAGQAGAGGGTPAPPAPLNAAPLNALTFTDATPYDYGVERCYSVRSVRAAGATAVIGEPSPRACMTPIDREAPAAPTGLAALGAEGVINLSWEPNGEADLAGYLVLRGRAGDATLQPLTSSPVAETHYADRDIMPGVQYVYAITAVDMQDPPNVSDESNRAEETAR